jgi:NADH-quinone oxidoreductase subunit G
VWRELAAAVPALRDASFAGVPDAGLVLDSAPYAALPFVEGETLHFKPAAKA